MGLEVLLRRMKEEYKNSDALTASLIHAKARLIVLNKLKKKKVRNTIRERMPAYAEWREISEDIDDEFEVAEHHRLKMFDKKHGIGKKEKIKKLKL